MRNYLILIAAALGCVTAAWLAQLALLSFFDIPHNTATDCIDEDGVGISASRSPSDFRQCIEANAKLFLRGDYAESKDFAKTFLTLLSGLLVVSITFSEKIVGIDGANTVPIIAMIACWCLLLFSIVCCGIALAVIAAAAGYAMYQPDLDYLYLQGRGVNFLIIAGVAFVFSLIAMITGGITSLVQKRMAYNRQ